MFFGPATLDRLIQVMMQSMVNGWKVEILSSDNCKNVVSSGHS